MKVKDWIREVTFKLNLTPQCSNLAIRILNVLEPETHKQLVTACALMIASKYYEDLDYILASEICFLLDYEYEYEDVLYCEVAILDHLNWSLNL